jgi:hypothetical protein
MTWVLVLLLAAEPAVEPMPLVPALAPAAVEHATLQSVGLAGSTVLLLAASTGAAFVAGGTLHGLPLAVNGRPNPWASDLGLLVGLGVEFALAHLALPAVAALWRPEHDAAAIRAQAWTFSRWPLAAGALGVVTFTVGAALEESRWGRGDGVMAAGLLVTVLSLLVFDVVEGLATWGAVR